jgi:hypothetical protein
MFGPLRLSLAGAGDGAGGGEGAGGGGVPPSTVPPPHAAAATAVISDISVARRFSTAADACAMGGVFMSGLEKANVFAGVADHGSIDGLICTM